MTRLGKVTATATTTSPLRVRLNGDPAGDPDDPPAEPYAGLTPTLGQEVLVQNVEGRRLIVWAAV